MLDPSPIAARHYQVVIDHKDDPLHIQVVRETWTRLRTIDGLSDIDRGRRQSLVAIVTVRS